MENCTENTASAKCGGTDAIKTVGQDSKNFKDKNKSKTRKSCEKLTTPSLATISISGMINIQNADNVHIGHNYTNESTLPKSDLPEHTIEKNESLERLLTSDKEISNQHRIAVSRHVGSNWRHLGSELGGFSNGQMDQLEEKFKAQLIPFDEMIYQLILKWEDHSEIKPTVGRLAQGLSKCHMNAALLAIITLENPSEKKGSK